MHIVVYYSNEHYLQPMGAPPIVYMRGMLAHTTITGSGVTAISSTLRAAVVRMLVVHAPMTMVITLLVHLLLEMQLNGDKLWPRNTFHTSNPVCELYNIYVTTQSSYLRNHHLQYITYSLQTQRQIVCALCRWPVASKALA